MLALFPSVSLGTNTRPVSCSNSLHYWTEKLMSIVLLWTLLKCLVKTNNNY